MSSSSLVRDRKYITVLLSLGKYKWCKGKRVTGQGYGLGIGGCKRLCHRGRGRGMAWLHCFPYLCQLRTGHCIRYRGQVTDLLSQAHTWVWALGRLVPLLSWIRRLFLDRLSGFLFSVGGPCTALNPGLGSGGLESQFGRGPRHPGQEGDGLVLLVPRVQAGHVFSGYPAGGINS